MTRRQERFRKQHQYIIRTIAKRDPVDADMVMRRQRFLQMKPVAVGVQGRLWRGLGDRGHDFCARSQRILV